MANNVIFSAATAKESYNSLKSKHKTGRIDLLSKDVAKELNTYKNFGVFKTYADTYAEEFKDGKPVSEGKGVADHPGTPGVRSLFNMYSAVLTGNSDTGWEDVSMPENIKKLVYNAQEFRLSNNVPLVDTPENRNRLKTLSGCSVRELVQMSHKGYFGRSVYSYADFMYCKHLGKVPNNYLITLRRYPVPIGDSINPVGLGGRRKDAGMAQTFTPVGTMVTWMGVSGNEVKNILKYNYKMPFKETSADWQSVSKEGGDHGILNQMEALMNPTTRKYAASGTNVDALKGLHGGMFGLGDGFPLKNQMDYDTEKVYGPIDRIKKSYKRGTDGLDQDHQFTLTFEYELKAYNGINPRQAMLDLLASIFAVTYSTGNFWGGGYKGTFIGQSSAFTNLNIFKCNGGFTDFMDAFINDVSGPLKREVESARAQIKSGGIINTAAEYIKETAAILNSIGGALLGGLLNKLGRPARYFTNSLVSDAPVGLWHITIGNPHHPIMSMGNMILKGTEIEHSGPLGLDDFPTGLKVTCTFANGKPRDTRGLEAMYMGGSNRIFYSMEGELASMYDSAAQYKQNTNIKPRDVKATVFKPDQLVLPSDTGKPEVEKIGAGKAFLNNVEKSMSTVKSKAILDYYFGSMDAYAIISSSKEQGHGMAKKPVQTDESKKAQ